jgi:hypothetical protein
VSLRLVSARISLLSAALLRGGLAAVGGGTLHGAGVLAVAVAGALVIREPGAVPPASYQPARHGLRPSGRGAAPAGGPPSAVLPPAAGMLVAGLSREWRRTAAVLDAAAVDPVESAQVVRRRGEVLDELERRDPAGFARWVAGGASAVDHPVHHRPGDPADGPGPA